VKAAPKREDESESLAALRALEVLDTGPEAEFDALVQAASVVCGKPIALVSLVDAERQWFKANLGLPGLSETPRGLSFCAHAVLGDGLLEVMDATLDLRFFDHPWVTGPQQLRFYAGAPLRLGNGTRIGTLCVFDRAPGRLDDRQRNTLRQLAVAVARALEGRWALRHARRDMRAAERAALLMQHSADAVIGVSALGLIERWNPAAEHMFGYTATSALGEPLRMLVPTGQQAQEAHAFRALRESGPQRYESVRLHMDKSLVDVALTLVPEFNDDGELASATQFLRDIGAQKAAAAQRARHEADLRLVVDNVPSMMAYWDHDLRCRFANRQYENWFGVEAGSLVGMHLRDLQGPEWFQEQLPNIEAVLRGDAQTEERSMTAPDGAVRYGLSHYAPDLFAGGVAGFLMQVSDISDHKRIEADLRDEMESRERIYDLLRQSAMALDKAQELGQIGSWEWQVAQDVTSWSPQLYRLFGFQAGRPPPGAGRRARYYVGESWRRLRRAIDISVRFGASFSVELEIVRADREHRWIDVRGEAVRNNNGKVWLVHGTAQDITQRKRAERELKRSQDFLERTGALAGVGGWELDLRDGRVRWSPEVCRIHGMRRGYQPTLEQSLAFFTPEARPIIEAAMGLAVAECTGFDVELEMVRSDGAPRWVHVVGTVDKVDGVAARLAGAFQDVTERRALMAELGEQHELLRVTLQSIGDAVITTHADGLVSWLNPVAERMTGWLVSEAIGRPLEQVFHIVNAETRMPAEVPVRACMMEKRVLGLARNTMLISRNGLEFGIEDSASPILNEQGELLGAVLVFHDVTEQRRLSGEMTFRATHDALTGLINRSEFEARLQRTLDSAHEDRREHALMFIDLDQFKLVNDACGHAAGDQLLQQVAKLLSETVRSRDTLARLGGDEFAVILEHCTSEQAGRAAQQICDRMDDYRFVHDGRRFRIGASIGLVPVDRRWASTASLLQAADTSCYAAKEAGRNRCHTWFDTDAAMHERHGEMQWASRLELALDEGRFALYAQRIFMIDDAPQGLHAEVLLRMIDTDGTLIQPGSFLPAAERFNLSSRIDRWVLRHSIDLLAALPTHAHIDSLCINLSGQSIGDRAFHRQATQMLRDAGSAVCGCICLEITETAAITNLADASLFIDQVHALGVRIALDDFGAGASSFGYLKSLAVDVLKIDGQFVKDILDDPLDSAAVRCFIDVAQIVGVKTVAEYVDNKEVLMKLREMGADFAQGFLLHRPEPIAAVLRPAVVLLEADATTD